jgi:hypothetical protein
MKKIIFSVMMIATIASAEAQETPTMGWSSWNTYGVNISEDLIKSQATAMVSKGLNTVGYKYINIDDGYFGGRGADGTLLIHPTRFPNGLRPVVTHIHNLGLKAGIYSDAGHNTCGNYYNGDAISKNVGLYEHDQKDCNMFFNDLKFDFIKVDFCGGDAGQNSEHLDLDEQTRYTEIHQAIVNTGRTDVVYNVCRWDYPGTWVQDISNSWRISHDIAASWSSVNDIINQNLYLSAYASKGHYNDMDMLEVGRGMTTEEDKTHFTLWCMMDSPLLIGCDMSKLSGETLSLLKNKDLIALNQDSLHLQAYVAKYTGGCYVLVKDFGELQGNKRAVAIYNPTDIIKSFTLSFKDVCLDGNVEMRDLFAQKDIGSMTESCKLSIPAHGTRVFMLTANKRLEQTRYEAETAYISDYQELTNNQTAKTGIYNTGLSQCSGNADAGWLGYSDKNDLQWKNIYSQEGGKYEMTIAFITGENRNINIEINGIKTSTLSLNSGSWTAVGTKKVEIDLNKGFNTIRFYNSANWMPDIDYIDLVNTTTSSIASITKSHTNENSIYSINGIKEEKANKGIFIVNGEKVIY